MVSYRTVYEGGTDEIVEKKSRFIAQVFPVHTEEEAAQLLEQTRKKYWDARHNCYAYVLGSKGEISRCSDDSEPSGTAGRPILEVIQGNRLSDVLVIVTRYFGGTLLGTGGLVRAYSQAAQAGIAASRLMTKQLGRRLTVFTDYNGIGKLQYVAAQLSLAVLDTVYTEQVELSLVIPLEQYDEVCHKITETTAGQAKLVTQEQEIYFAEADGKILLFSS